MGYYLTYCFDIDALDVIFAGIFSFLENSLSQLILLHLQSYCAQCTLPIQNIVISYRAHIFYYEVVRNYDVTERFPYQ